VDYFIWFTKKIFFLRNNIIDLSVKICFHIPLSPYLQRIRKKRTVPKTVLFFALKRTGLFWKGRVALEKPGYFGRAGLL
jgi:hypothetical protein